MKATQIAAIGRDPVLERESNYHWRQRSLKNSHAEGCWQRVSFAQSHNAVVKPRAAQGGQQGWNESGLALSILIYLFVATPGLSTVRISSLSASKFFSPVQTHTVCAPSLSLYLD